MGAKEKRGVEQAGQLPDVVPWSPGEEGLLCAHGGQAAWDSVLCNWEELILAGLVHSAHSEVRKTIRQRVF